MLCIAGGGISYVAQATLELLPDASVVLGLQVGATLPDQKCLRVFVLTILFLELGAFGGPCGQVFEPGLGCTPALTPPVQQGARHDLSACAVRAVSAAES